MQRIEIKRWNGQIQHQKTIEKIRSKITGAIKSGHTVLLDFEGTKGLTPEIVYQIIDGWEDSQVKIATCGTDK